MPVTERVGSRVDLHVCLCVGEVAGGADRRRQKPELGGGTVLAWDLLEPPAGGVDRQDADRRSDQLDRQPAQRCPVALGDRQRCRPGQLTAGDEGIDGAELQLRDFGRREGVGEGREPQVVGPEPVLADLRDHRHLFGERLEVDGRARDAADDLVVAHTGARERVERPPRVGVELGDDLLACVADSDVVAYREGEPDKSRPAPVAVGRARVLAESGGEGRLLVGAEGEVLLADLGQPIGGAEMGEWDGRRLPPGEDEVGVPGEPSHQLAQQLRGRRSAGDLVDVVEHHAELERRLPAQAVDDVGDRVLRPRRDSDCGQDRGGQVLGLLVTGLAPDPGIDADRRHAVRPHRLGEGGRLPETGSRHHQRHRAVPPRCQTPHEARPRELVGDRPGWAHRRRHRQRSAARAPPRRGHQ